MPTWYNVDILNFEENKQIITLKIWKTGKTQPIHIHGINCEPGFAVITKSLIEPQPQENVKRNTLSCISEELLSDAKEKTLFVP